MEREKTASSAYSDEEYGERLDRLLGGTGYARDYIELLTDPSKSENGDAFDRFVRCLKGRSSARWRLPPEPSGRRPSRPCARWPGTLP